MRVHSKTSETARALAWDCDGLYERAMAAYEEKMLEFHTMLASQGMCVLSCVQLTAVCLSHFCFFHSLFILVHDRLSGTDGGIFPCCRWVDSLH